MSYKARPAGSIFAALDLALVEIGDSSKQPGNGAQVAGDFLGKTKWTVIHECDPEDTKHRMSVRTLGLLAQRFRLTSLAHWFAAAAGGFFTPCRIDITEPRFEELTAQSFEDMGKVGAEIFRDLADGEFDQVEMRRSLLRVEEHQRHLAELASALRYKLGVPVP